MPIRPPRVSSTFIATLALLAAGCSSTQPQPVVPAPVTALASPAERAAMDVEREKTLRAARELIDAEGGAAPRTLRESVAAVEIEQREVNRLTRERDCLKKHADCATRPGRTAAQSEADLAVAQQLLSEFHARLQQELAAVADLHRVPFRTLNATRLRRDGIDALQHVMAALHEQRRSCTKVLVLGFGCAVGTDEQNLRVSQRRADAVAAQLRSASVARCPIAVDGRGIAIPEATIADHHLTPAERERVLEGSREVVVLILRRAPMPADFVPAD